jgi:hypothetical protein
LPAPQGIQQGIVAGETGRLEVVKTALGNVRFGSEADIWVPYSITSSACPSVSFASLGMSHPTRRTRSPCCARAVNGQAAAEPAGAVMNSRRRIANDGHDTRAIQAYLGHRSIMSTVRYTALTPNRFKNFWKD